MKRRMGKIKLTAVTVAGGIIPKDQALLALKVKELRRLPPLAVMGRQLEAFLPGGVVERLVKRFRGAMAISDCLSEGVSPDAECFAQFEIGEKAITELEALLPRKEER